GRNPFKFGPPPGKPAEPLKGPEPKIPLPPVAEVKVAPPPPAPAPPPPPIALKYYGFSSPPGAGGKTAFFLDGEDSLVASEGETVKRRYPVVRIGVTPVVMEDTDSKRQHTSPLAEEAGCGGQSRGRPGQEMPATRSPALQGRLPRANRVSPCFWSF